MATITREITECIKFWRANWRDFPSYDHKTIIADLKDARAMPEEQAAQECLRLGHEVCGEDLMQAAQEVLALAEDDDDDEPSP